MVGFADAGGLVRILHEDCAPGLGDHGRPDRAVIRQSRQDHGSDIWSCQRVAVRRTRNVVERSVTLTDSVRLLPTPCATDTGTAGRRAGKGFRPPLSQQVLPLVDDEVTDLVTHEREDL